MKYTNIQKRWATAAVLAACAVCPVTNLTVLGQSNGNPRPGYPHDTITIHVKNVTGGAIQCDGGHALFLREDNGDVLPAKILITMIDWAQIDNDVDGRTDEDPKDGVDNDLDGKVDEDPTEPGADTKAIDCDAWGDAQISLQIRDTDPRAGFVSTQEWFIRAIGKPGENMAFTTAASQVVECHQFEINGVPQFDSAGQPVIVCTYGEWIDLASFNLAALGAVKQVKGTKAGGKTPFADITSGFLVDLFPDTNGNGVIDLGDDLNGDGVGDIYDDLNGDTVVNEFDLLLLEDQFVFSISCFDNPSTPLNETLYCPLSNLVWDIDDEITTSKAKAQVFVAHTGSANVRTGKISKPQ